MLTLWEIISDDRFELDSRAILRKPGFFFSDSIEEDEAAFYDGDYKWLRQIGNKRSFHLNMERMYPLAYLQAAIYVHVSDNGLEVGQANLQSYPGQDRCP